MSRNNSIELTPGVRVVDAAVETAFDVTDNVILVLPKGLEWDGRPVLAVVPGGASRLDSVAAGLSALPEDQEIVVVHDAAHPLAPRETFVDVIEAVRDGADAAVPFLSASDVIKAIDHDRQLTTVGRDRLGLAQVPMGFSAASLLAAHDNEAKTIIWEDSMLIERANGRVSAVPGSPTNFHIVSQEELELARLIAQQDRMINIADKQRAE